MHISPPFTPVSPLATQIPANPLRALYKHASKPSMINLASGHPSLDAYDFDGLMLATELAANDSSSWTYGASAGDPGLRQQLQSLSPTCPDEYDLTIVSGAQQGIDLAFRCLAAPGRTVAVPEPVYPAVLSICAAAGLKPVAYQAAPSDPDWCGLETVIDQHDVAVVYALPTFSNPDGQVWPVSMRERFLQLCAEKRIAIVEDDPYRLLSFSEVPPPSLLELSIGYPNLTVVYAGSLSKVIAPGLRLGWMVARNWLSSLMTAMRQAGDLQPNALAQRVAYHYLRSGRLDDHLCHVRALYADRSMRLTRILSVAGFDCGKIDGGMFVFAKVPGGWTDQEFFDRAVARNVLVVPGRAFAVGVGSGLASQVRLCFAGQSAEMIELAAHRLLAAATGT